MTASGEPAVCIRGDISGLPAVIESCDGRFECNVPKDIVEIAESIDEVRGIGCASGRKPVAGEGGEAVGRGDGGDDLPRGMDSGNGDETFRSWL